MKTQQAIDHYGSVAKLAAALNISRTAVYLWKEDVPEGRAYQLELMTGGALKAVDGAAPAAPANTEAAA